MFIGYLCIDFFIPHSQSLKEKRQVISGLKQRVKNKFNVSVAEKASDKWQTCEVSFACVHSSRQGVENELSSVEEFVRRNRDIDIMKVEKEIF